MKTALYVFVPLLIITLACAEPPVEPVERPPVQFAADAPRWPTPVPTRIRTQPTRVPTRAWTQLPTPVPTEVQRSVVTSPAGLGISRDEFRAIYEDVGLTCTGGSPVAEYSKGYETWRCETPLASPLNVELEVAGQLIDDDVVYSRLFIHNPDKNGPVAALHTGLFLQSTLPRWSGSLEWVDAHMLDALDGKPRTTSHGDSFITIMWIDGPTFVVQVRGR